MSRGGRTYYFNVLLATTTASFITPFTSSSIALALPTLSDEFNVSLAEVNWVANVFLIALSSSVLVFGRLSDWLGRGRVFLVGIVLFTITSLTTILVGNYPAFLAFRFLQGVSSAMIASTAAAILADSFPRERRGLVMGVNVMAVYIGSTSGPLLGGYLIGHFGWRSLFIVKAAVCLISLILTVMVVSLAGGIASKPNQFRLLTTSTSIVLIVVGAANLNSVVGVLTMLCGALIFVSTLMVEWGNPKILHRSMFCRRFLAANIAALLNYSATFALTILLSNYLQRVRGFQPGDAGLILAAQPTIQALFSPMAGLLADRYEPSAIASVGMFVTAIGVGSLMLIGETTPITNLTLILAVLGMGFTLFASPNTTAIMNIASREAYGSAAAFLATMRFVGQALSTSIITSVMAVEKNLLIATKTSLTIYIALSILGALLSLMARGKRLST